MAVRQQISEFLACDTFAVVGASNDRHKFGNKVLRMYQQYGYKAFAVNPNAEKVEGQTSYPSLASLPAIPQAVSIITPPRITEAVVAEAMELGISNLWLQPGAESATAVDACSEPGINLIYGGPCILVEVGFPD